MALRIIWGISKAVLGLSEDDQQRDLTTYHSNPFEFGVIIDLILDKEGFNFSETPLISSFETCTVMSECGVLLDDLPHKGNCAQKALLR